MRKLITILCLSATPASAMNCTTTFNGGFAKTYCPPDSYALGYNGGSMGAAIAQQRNTEALVNAIRAQRGLPPCSIGLLGQWQGRPAC